MIGAVIAPRPGLRRLFALAPLGLALACGGGEVQVVAPGDAFAEPSMEALPSIGQSRESLSETMRFAWQLTEESFELAAFAVQLRKELNELNEVLNNLKKSGNFEFSRNFQFSQFLQCLKEY